MNLINLSMSFIQSIPSYAMAAVAISSVLCFAAKKLDHWTPSNGSHPTNAQFQKATSNAQS
jgi:hypothetical protein